MFTRTKLGISAFHLIFLRTSFLIGSKRLSAGTFSKAMALLYIGVVMVCMIAYYAINIHYKKNSFREDFTKLLFILFILCVGGVAPIIFG